MTYEISQEWDNLVQEYAQAVEAHFRWIRIYGSQGMYSSQVAYVSDVVCCARTRIIALMDDIENMR
jgi:hypothetical protein